MYQRRQRMFGSWCRFRFRLSLVNVAVALDLWTLVLAETSETIFYWSAFKSASKCFRAKTFVRRRLGVNKTQDFHRMTRVKRSITSAVGRDGRQHEGQTVGGWKVWSYTKPAQACDVLALVFWFVRSWIQLLQLLFWMENQMTAWKHSNHQDSYKPLETEPMFGSWFLWLFRQPLCPNVSPAFQQLLQ